MKKRMKLEVEKTAPDYAYLYFSDFPESEVKGKVKKSIALRQLIRYNGPIIHLDFGDDSQLLRMEIIDHQVVTDEFIEGIDTHSPPPPILVLDPVESQYSCILEGTCINDPTGMFTK